MLLPEIKFLFYFFSTDLRGGFLRWTKRQSKITWLSSQKHSKQGGNLLRKYYLQMTRKVLLPLAAWASESKIKTKCRAMMASNSEVFMMCVVLKTAPRFSTSLAKSSKTPNEDKLVKLCQKNSKDVNYNWRKVGCHSIDYHNYLFLFCFCFKPK